MSNLFSACSRCRQLGEKLFLKGIKCRTAKCTLERRATTPGQHSKRIGTRRQSEYGKQLSEKQKAKLIYGVRERQFRRFFVLATKCHGITGDLLLSMLERRLDNVVYRLKIASSKVQARQFIVHGHVTVNSQSVYSPSYLVKANDIIALNNTTLKNTTFIENFIDKRINVAARVPEWLELNKKERKGIVIRKPIRNDITAQIKEHLIVELYSK